MKRRRRFLSVRSAAVASALRFARLTSMTLDSVLRCGAARRLRELAGQLEQLAQELESGDARLGLTFPSARDGTCSLCTGPIRAGGVIVWATRTAICSRCVNPDAEAAA